MSSDIVKTKIIILLLFCIFFPLALLGCGNEDTVGNGASDETLSKNGFSEYDFCSDPNIRVSPENVAALFLEPSDAKETDMPDTGDIGTDYIPIIISDANRFFYSLDTGDDTIESAVMTDSTGSLVFRIDHDSPDIEVYLKPGNYSLTVHSGYTTGESGNADHRVVFLCPDMGFKSSKETNTGQESFKLALWVNSAPLSNLRGINLSGANLTSADLYSSNLVEARLNAASLEEANLEGVDMREAQLYAANMQNINLANASAQSANLYAANLTNANLISADLSNANLFSAEMENINLLAARLDNAYLYSADLSHGNMEGASLKEANLASAYLYKANLLNGNLTSANLADADFSYSVLRNAILTGAITEGTDFTGADMTGIVW